MDKKQEFIYNNICKKNNLPHKNTFIQHRNLREFRDFYIERINPNHIIFLYGKLKKPYIHDKHYNKVIKVGEIVLSIGFVMLIDNYILNIAINIISGSILLSFLLDYILEFDINVNRNRREFREWKNSVYGSLCID